MPRTRAATQTHAITDMDATTHPLTDLALCPSITDARYTTTTEVYPDSPRTTPEECVRAQVAAVRAALDYVLAHP